MVVVVSLLAAVFLLALLSTLNAVHKRVVVRDLKLAAIQHAKSAAEAVGIVVAPTEPLALSDADLVRNSGADVGHLVTKDGRVLEPVTFENL